MAEGRDNVKLIPIHNDLETGTIEKENIEIEKVQKDLNRRNLIPGNPIKSTKRRQRNIKNIFNKWKRGEKSVK